ncbi:MAG: hypothetical protein KBD16_00045 [Candidatus Pacebacteria bacterium]|nr:hypothetical protein [Candidatus Paceibacterota bacterium]
MRIEKTRIRKSPHFQVVGRWNETLERFEVEDVVWPNEKPFNASVDQDFWVAEVNKEGLSGDGWMNFEILFAVLQAHDLHGSEDMRGAFKIILSGLLNNLAEQGMIRRT